MRSSRLLLLAIACFVPTFAQSDYAAILARLDKLEQENRALTEKVAELERRLVGAAPIEERLDIQERRTEELAQSKVEASQRLPISITGMLLFNAFLNSRHNGVNDFPTLASAAPVPRTGGASARQTVLGLRFRSPSTVLGAEVNGSLYMDFFSNLPSNTPPQRVVSNNLNRLMRLRLATVELDWNSTSLLVGQDKPIISPREPTSIAQVGVSPLTNAGNPWLWQPQIRIEQRVGDLRFQFGLFQTSEQGALLPDTFAPTLESSRPGYQGRFAYRRDFDNDAHFEVATGFHASTTHVAATSVPSRIYSLDWSMSPDGRLGFTGMYYRGQNTANLGTLRQGFTILGPRDVFAIHSNGGWAQVSYEVTPRLTFNAYGGQHDDRDRDLRGNQIGKNFAYAGNALYRIAPNVVIGLELMQARTTYLQTGRRLNNHYDLALAYQF
jgi:hypothetical protein